MDTSTFLGDKRRHDSRQKAAAGIGYRGRRRVASLVALKRHDGRRERQQTRATTSPNTRGDAHVWLPAGWSGRRVRGGAGAGCYLCMPAWWPVFQATGLEFRADAAACCARAQRCSSMCPREVTPPGEV